MLKYNKKEIIDLILKGKSYSEISNLLGCAKSTISYHAHKNELGIRKLPIRYNWKEINNYYHSEKTITVGQCKEKFGFSTGAWNSAVERGDLLSKKRYTISYEELFVENCKHDRITVKKYIIKNKLFDYVCKECKITNWKKRKLSLHLDHINGIHNDNRIENLRFLCPNCHSLTETYGGKNNKK